MAERGRGAADQRWGRGEGRALSFIDHHRQRYAERVQVPCDAEFLIGDFEDGRGIGDLGEFKVELHYLGERRGMLHPRLCVFGDATGALAALLDLADGDLGSVLRPVRSREEFSSRLVAFGLHDVSGEPPLEGR